MTNWFDFFPRGFGAGAAAIVLVLAVAGCTTASLTGEPGDPQPGAMTAAPSTATESDAEPPMERHEASAECWMKYDKTGGSLDTKTRLVDACIAEKTGAAPAAAKPSGKPSTKPGAKPKRTAAKPRAEPRSGPKNKPEAEPEATPDDE